MALMEETNHFHHVSKLPGTSTNPVRLHLETVPDVDLLVTWPTNCDFPLWRAFLARERWRFARVIVSFSPHPGRLDYRDFVREELAHLDVDLIYPEVPGGRDWRDVAVNAALDVSDAGWVWFTEQDFDPDPQLWLYVRVGMRDGYEVIGLRQDGRWHPCCLFVRRALVELTPRYFGPEPVDHFYAFGRKVTELVAPLELPFRLYRHQAGLSRNHQLLDLHQYEEVYRPDEFAAYLRRCTQPGTQPKIRLEPRWLRQATNFLWWYNSRG